MNDNQFEEPNFSGDDFANDKNIQAYRRMKAEEKRLFNESVNILKSNLHLENSSHKNLKAFYMFRSLEPIVCSSFRSKNHILNLLVSIVEYSTAFPTAKNANSGSDNYVFGCLELKETYPDTYICKETIREKIADLFLRNDTDFREHRRFSRRFHVATQDDNKLASLFQFKSLDELAEFSDMEVEFRGKQCLFRNSRRAFSPREAIEFAELAIVLTSSIK